MVIAFLLLYRPTAVASEQDLPPQLNKTDSVQAAQNPSQPVQEQKPSEVIVAETPVVPQPTPEPLPVEVVGDKYDLMRAAGIPESDWIAVDYIISHESSWRHTAYNGSGSGAYGLCQALPASKMASAGEDYINNPVTQLKWCHSYAQSRYGGWQSSLAYWQANKWW